MGVIRERKDGMLELTIIATGEVEKLLLQLQPYLIIKRPQANILLEILKRQKSINSDHEFLEVKKLIDKLETLKDSKKRTKRAELVEKKLFPPVET